MSPRPSHGRVRLVALRLTEAGLSAVDDAAKAAGRNRSEQLRLMLAFAQQRMPRDWKPRA